MSSPAPNGSRLRFGAFDLDLITGELHKLGHLVHLRPQAAKVLTVLAARGGEIVTREQLCQEVWGKETFVDFERGLNLCIREVRAALSDDAETPRYIETLPKRGYRFIAPIERETPASTGARQPTTAGARRRALWPLYAGIAVAVLVVLVLANPGNWRDRILPGPPIHTIAVLPLNNLSGDSAQDYFAEGITEALTTELARLGRFSVISRTSSMQYKGIKKSLPEIARELNADAIVEGSVLRSGDRVRVTAQLIRASTDRHLWAGNFERDVRDVVALQDEVALTIAKQIGAGQEGPPAAAAAAMTPRVSPEGYEAYLKGTYYLDRWDLQKSIEYFNQTIKLEPGFAAPYARMARAYFYLAFFGALTPHEGCGKAKQAAEAAIERDPTLPEAHGTLALVKLHYDWDFVGAEKEFKRALELNPSDADVRHDYAHHLMALGRVQESQQESRRAVQLDPIGSALTSCLCWHSFAARDYDQAVDLAMKYLRAQPDDAFEHTILGWSYEQKKLYPEAVKEFSRAVELAPGDAFFQAPLGHGYAVAGRTADAEKVLNDLIQRRKKAYVSAFDIALIKAGLGKKDEAFGWLDRAAQEHSIFLVYSKWEPRLDPLRSDPRFEALLKRVGLS